MSFDRECRERWNHPYSNDQHRPNFNPNYNTYGPFQEFPQQELDVSGFNYQPMIENSQNFYSEANDFQKNEFNSTISQVDLNLASQLDEKDTLQILYIF
jgi:hypothetical protein